MMSVEEFRCLSCCRSYSAIASLTQHGSATGHTVTAPKGDHDKARRLYLTSLLQMAVFVDADDRKESVALTSGTMRKILDNVRSQEGGKIYSADLRKAGSHSVKMKIGKADEFDFNVKLNVTPTDVRTTGGIQYQYEDTLHKPESGPSPSNLNVDRKLKALKGKRPIKAGYASVAVNPHAVPEHLLYEGDLIPHAVKRDLHQKISKSIVDLGLQRSVDVSCDAHGPAVTLTIHQGGLHDISVDVTSTIDYDHPVSMDGWPHPGSILQPDIIAKVRRTGVHLVPKGDELWNISFSKCEKVLLQGMDQGNGCRKQCHQILKRYVQVCMSQSGEGLPGISSHILKHGLLWMNDRRTDDPDHWHQRNLAARTSDMLEEIQRKLRSGVLDNYFNTTENILTGKSRSILNRLADFFVKEKKALSRL